MAKVLFEYGDTKITDETQKNRTQVVNGKEVWFYSIKNDVFWYYPNTGKVYIVGDDGELMPIEGKELKSTTVTSSRTFKWLVVGAIVVGAYYYYFKKRG